MQCVEGQDMRWGAKLPCQVQIILIHHPEPSPRATCKPDRHHLLAQVQSLKLGAEHSVSQEWETV